MYSRFMDQNSADEGGKLFIGLGVGELCSPAVVELHIARMGWLRGLMISRRRGQHRELQGRGKNMKLHIFNGEPAETELITTKLGRW